VYVKPYANEDMSSYVKKVQFKLHESYANPNRSEDSFLKLA
jgi:YEATS domain-containing protein 4